MAKTVRNNQEEFIRDSEENIRGTDDDAAESTISIMMGLHGYLV